MEPNAIPIDNLYLVDDKGQTLHKYDYDAGVTDLITSIGDALIELSNHVSEAIAVIQLYREVYGDLMYLAFSNNWLKLHGIPMRRRANSRAHRRR